VANVAIKTRHLAEVTNYCINLLHVCVRTGIFICIRINRDRQCMYKRYIEARSRNHCCLGKAISIIYSECLSLALVIQHVERMCRVFIVICDPCVCSIFLHIMLLTVPLSDKSY